MATDDPFSVLTTPAPALSADEAGSILLQAYALSGQLEPLTSERDQNFLVSASDGDKFVLKIANSAEDPGVTDLQTSALIHLAEVAPEQPVPRVIPTSDGHSSVTHTASDGRSHVVRVLSWLDGIPLQHAEREPGYAATLGSCLARLGLALREFQHPASTYALLWDLKGASALRELLECVDDTGLRSLCAERLDVFEESVKPRFDSVRWQVIHNDLNPSNVLVDASKPTHVTGIIDFGDLAFSPLVADVAVGAAYLLRDDDEALADVREFISAYCEIEALEPLEIDLLYDLILTRSTMTVLITHWRAARYPENRDYILRNETRARRLLKRLHAVTNDSVLEQLREAAGLAHRTS